MDFVRFNPTEAQPLPGGVNATYVPVNYQNQIKAMLVALDRKGDTGKREAPTDALISVVAGEGRCRSGGAIADLKEGDVAILPAGILHQIWTSDSTMQFVMVSLT